MKVNTELPKWPDPTPGERELAPDEVENMNSPEWREGASIAEQLRAMSKAEQVDDETYQAALDLVLDEHGRYEETEGHGRYDGRYRRLDLSGRNLRGASFENAKMGGAWMEGASLAEAYLFRADLREARLDEGDLTGADLRGASLRWADLRGANVSGATLPAPARHEVEPDLDRRPMGQP